MFKKTHSPSRMTTHISKQVSAHTHSHSHGGGHTLSQGGGSVISKSQLLAKKAVCSPSHKSAHASDQVPTHSHSHGGDLVPSLSHHGSTHSNSKALKHTRSPFLKAVYTGGNVSAHSGDDNIVSTHSTDQTQADRNASPSSHSSPSRSTVRPSNRFSTHSHSASTGDKTLTPSHSNLLKRTHSPSRKTAHQISTHGGEHVLSPSQLPEQAHGDSSACPSSLSSTVKTSLSLSHRANKQVSAHGDGSALSNAHTKALKRTRSPSRRMVHSHDRVSTGSHLEKFGGNDDLLPPLQANTSQRTCSSSCKTPSIGNQPSSHSLIQSPPRKAARVDDVLVQSQTGGGSACPMTVNSPHKISQNLGPSQSEATAVSSQTSQVSLGNLSLIKINFNSVHVRA